MLLLSGCASAPSLELFGAYFPAWLFCAAFGIIAGFAAHAVFIATGWANRLPFQFFLCASIGLLFGLFAWQLSFGS